MSGRAMSIWLSKELEQALRLRGRHLSSNAVRDLKRYYSLLQRSLPRWLGPGEAKLICEALRGEKYPEPVAPAAWLFAKVDNAIRQRGLDKKWKAEGEALLERLQALAPAQALAIIDAAEQVWAYKGDFEGRVIEAFMLAPK